MDRLEFLKSVLGDEGYYCAVGIKNGKKPIHKYYKTLEEVCTTADDFCANGIDAYFALGTFWKDGSREGGNVQQLRSLYVDIDYGPHHNKAAPYDTYEEAFGSLKSFCKEVGLQRPHVINSGGGIHAYWPLETPVDKEVWLPLSTQLKELCITNNLHIDTVVTTDAARILRIPATKNFKTEEGRDVSIIYPATRFGSVDHYVSILGEPIRPIKKMVQRDEVSDAILGHKDKSFKRIMRRTLNGTGCEQLRFMYEHQDQVDLASWRAALSIIKCCYDGEPFVHRISERHPKYTYEETEKVYNGTSGAISCAYIRTYMSEQGRSSVCDECPHWGKINTPLSLGIEVVEATEERVVEAVPEDSDTNEKVTYTIPKYPFPYFNGKNGGIFKRIKTKEGDEIEMEIYHNDFYVINRMRDRSVGDLIVLRLHLPHDGVREFTMPMGVVATSDEFKKQLYAQGVVATKLDELKSYILTSVKNMQGITGASEAYSQFGWVDDKCTAFVVGNKKVYADRIEPNFPTATTESLFPAFEKKGSFEAWKDAMEFYNKPGMEQHQFVIGLGFGSIFTHFTAVNAGIYHMYSPESGLGKTTALYAAMSIWGDPIRLVMKETDTTASKMLRLQVYKNILLCSDEMTNAFPKTLSDEAYQVTSGMQRSRLRSSTNEERTRGQPWKTTMVSTGNSSMTEKIQSWKAIPKGEMLRILDDRVKKVVNLSKEETDKLSISLLSNYGHVAVPYLQYVMRNIDGWKTTYENIQRDLDNEVGLSSVERFYSVMAVNGLLGLYIANKAGFTNFNLKRLKAWIVQMLTNALAEAEDVAMNPEEIISSFWAEHYSNILRIKSSTDLRKKDSEVEHLINPDATPRGELNLRYEFDVKKLYIRQEVLLAWCVKRGISYKELTHQMKLSGMAVKGSKRMGAGTRSDMGSQSVVIVNCKWMTDEKEEEIKRLAEITEANTHSAEP